MNPWTSPCRPRSLPAQSHYGLLARLQVVERQYSRIGRLRNNVQALQEDAFIDIKESQLRYFGGPGKMLLPSVGTVASLIRRVPPGQLLTTSGLRQELARQFGVQGTCPVTTKNALRAIAHDPQQDVAYWRVIKQNGELIAYFPGGTSAQAERLEQEGLGIDLARKTPRVSNFMRNLYQYDG